MQVKYVAFRKQRLTIEEVSFLAQALVFMTRSDIGLMVFHCWQLGQHQCKVLTTKPQLTQR